MTASGTFFYGLNTKMAEENQNAQNPEQPQQPQQQSQEPSFQMVRCYLKDASLEMPHAPQVFLQAPDEQPNVDIQFEVSQHLIEGVSNGYEVIVRGTITVGTKKSTMFLVEGKQAGLFDIRNIPEDDVRHLLNVLCPSIVYPYLRANLADLINRTGLPTVNLPEVNFEALYQQRLAQQQAQQQNGAAAPAPAAEGEGHA